MSEHVNNRQLIDDYLAGKMSASEMEAFETTLSKDNEIRSEFEFQKAVVDQIKQTRRLELKTRLDNINVNWYHTIPGSWKIAAAISLLTVSTLSAYFYIDQRTEPMRHIDLKETKGIQVQPTDENLPDKPTVNIKEEQLTDDMQVEEKSRQDALSEKDEIISADASEKETPTTDQNISDRDFQIDVTVPDDIDDDFSGANDIDMNDAVDDNLNRMSPSMDNMNSKVGVETINHKKYTFHYKMGDGQLTLYGNFDEIPYEILEINSSDGKRFFLKYRDNYYTLNPSPEIKELKPVTDEKLLNELKIVEENK